jgi:L-aminopeptidase/D-esterase-like protein
MKGLTDIPGVLVGHASDLDALTGCTAILCPGGAVAGVDVRGGATGTEELGLFSPLHLTERIHGVSLAGGSAFGLEAASGVRRYLEKQGIGFETGAAKVPLVTGAILYDLGIGSATIRPTREMGEEAAAAASDDPVAEGAVGAGTGATVGKLYGMRQAMKAGVGSATVELSGPHSGVLVSALAAVNAFGDIRDPDNGTLVAGTRVAPDSLDLADTAARLQEGGRQVRSGENTTLVVVATNAALNKPQASRLAQMASVGMARAISPVWTTGDGDIVIALAAGSRSAPVDILGTAAGEAVAKAIVRSVRFASALGGIPAVGRWPTP